jgi:hypothetical protein
MSAIVLCGHVSALDAPGQRVFPLEIALPRDGPARAVCGRDTLAGCME